MKVYEAQESIEGNRFRLSGIRSLGSLKRLQIRALLIEILKLCWQNWTIETKELRDRSECRLLCFISG